MKPKNSPEYSFLDEFLAGNNGFPGAIDSLCSSSFYTNSEVVEFAEKSSGRNSSSAASENHKEAERKRRERINGHLDRLRALLFCNSKTDKASLLAKVVERVRELKQQTTEIMQLDKTFPSEADEIAVLKHEEYSFDGRSVVIEASLCCEDRFDLVPDLIEVLKPLPLSLLRAEMVTLGGRMRNVIILGGDENRTDETVLMLKESLKTLVLRSNYVVGERSKRRRMFDQRMIIG